MCHTQYQETLKELMIKGDWVIEKKEITRNNKELNLILRKRCKIIFKNLKKNGIKWKRDHYQERAMEKVELVF